MVFAVIMLVLGVSFVGWGMGDASLDPGGKFHLMLWGGIVLALGVVRLFFRGSREDRRERRHRS